MKEQSFEDLMLRELISLKLSLIPLYETRDRLLYIDAPKMKNAYIERIGAFEDEVLQKELEAELLHEKIRLIRVALNRREQINVAVIDAMLEEKKNELINQARQSELVTEELPQLSEKEKTELQLTYRSIITDYHPALNKDLSEIQKTLYEKALIAYQNQNLEELKIVEEMLSISNGEGFAIDVEPLKIEKTEIDAKGLYSDLSNALKTDYKLAKEVLPFFTMNEEDITVLGAIDEYRNQYEALENEITEIKSSFPFNAASVISSDKETEEYMVSLRVRLNDAENEIASLNTEIMQMTGAV